MEQAGGHRLIESAPFRSVRRRTLLLLIPLALLAGSAAAPVCAQQAPRNYWDLREPSHTEEHAQTIQDTAPAPAASEQAPAPAPSQSPAAGDAGSPATPAQSAPAPERSSAAPAPPSSAQQPSAQAPAPAQPSAPAGAATAQPSAGLPGGTQGAPATEPGSAPAAAPSAGSQTGAATSAEPAPEDVRSLDRLYRLGDAARRRGDIQDAERYLKQLLQRAPYHFGAHVALGRLYLRGKPAQAAQQLETAARVHPSSEEAHYLLGQAYEALGRDLDAAEQYRRTIYINPRNYNANARLRGVLRRMRAGRTVVQRAAESFYQHPSLASLTLFGRIVMEQMEPRQAVLEFEEVQQHLPNLPEVQLWLARARHAADDAPGEVAAYRQYLVQRPQATGVRLLLVQRLVERGWYQDALEMLKPFVTTEGGAAAGLPPSTVARVTFLRSRLLSAQQKPAEAGDLLLLARQQGYGAAEIDHAFAEDLALYPEAPSLWLDYGEWLRGTGKPAQAADALAQAGLLGADERGKARSLLTQMHETGDARVATALALGQLAWADRDGKQALTLLREVPPGNALDHRAALLRGLIHRAQGDTDAALDAFTRYVFFFQDRGDMLYARGNVFWQIGRQDEALAIWQTHPEVLLKHPDVLLHMAEHYRSAGDVADEMATRERLVKVLPGNQDNRIRLGELYDEQGRHRDAATLWEQVLNERPRDAGLLARTGKAWLALGEHDRALPLLQRASQLQALDPDTSLMLARELYRSHQYEDALGMYWSLYQAQPQNPDLPRVLPELVLSLPATQKQRAVAAKLAEQAGRLGAAADVLEALLDDQPDDTAARMTLAGIYLRQDNAKRAEAVLMAAGSGPGATEDGLKLMATVEERLGRKAALADTLARLQVLHPDDAGLVRKRALLLASMRRFEEARPLLESASAAAPRDASLHLALADAALALGDPVEGEQHLRAVLAIDPAQPDAQRRLIELLLHQQRWSDVIPRLETWVQQNPRDAKAQYNLITAYLKAFRKDDAKPHYEALRRLSPRRAASLQPYFQ